MRAIAYSIIRPWRSLYSDSGLVIEYSLQPSVVLSECVLLPSAFVANGRSDIDTVSDGRSDWSLDKAGSCV